MSNKTTSQEIPLGIFDGSELIRLAKGGQNYKATSADLGAYLVGLVGGLPNVLITNPNTGGHNLNVTYGDSLYFPNPTTPAVAGYFKQDGVNGLCYADYTGTPRVYFYYPAKGRAWISSLEATDLFSATILTYALSVGYQYSAGNHIAMYGASSGIYRLRTPAIAGDVNMTFPVREAATITVGQVLQVSGVAGAEIATNWVTPAAATLAVGTTTITGGTAGCIIYDNGSVISESANLFWDNTNSQLQLLGAGTAALPTLAIGTSANGIYYSATNEIGLATAGVLRYKYDGVSIRSVTARGFTIVRAAGAAAAPTYSFAGSTNYGYWLNGTTHQFTTNGVNIFGVTNDNVIQLNNPANTFKYLITPAALTTADRILNLPLITGTDTFSVLGLAQTYSAAKTFTATVTITDVDVVLSGTTGTKFGTATTQKLSFWNATPIVQPTTAITAATFVANTSAIANDTATFDGYTIGKVVKALRNLGILA